jgi:hypothetical protein
MDYTIKSASRDRKVEKRRRPDMVVTNRSIFTIVEQLGKKAKAVKGKK